MSNARSDQIRKKRDGPLNESPQPLLQVVKTIDRNVQAALGQHRVPEDPSDRALTEVVILLP